jgi:SAM-dependent methyltransferase
VAHPYTSIFNRIYANNEWTFGSGAGSLPAATREYRAFLQPFLAQNRVRSVVDLGCGDWQTSSLVDWSGIDYVGVDVSTDIVRQNTERFAKPGVRFEAFTSFDALPSADLLIVKDVLQHLPSADVSAVLGLEQFAMTVATNCVQGDGLNGDVEPGGFRPLKLGDAPFNAKGVTVLRYESPLELCFRPKLDLFALAQRLVGRRAWVKEVFVIRR